MTGRGTGRGIPRGVPPPIPAVPDIDSLTIRQEPSSAGKGRGFPRSAGAARPTGSTPVRQEKAGGDVDKRCQNFAVNPGHSTYRIPDKFRERFKTLTSFDKTIGKDGNPVKLKTNYFAMQETPWPHLYQVAYMSVNFEPFVMTSAERRSVVSSMQCLQGEDVQYHYDGKGSLFMSAVKRDKIFRIPQEKRLGISEEISEPFSHLPDVPTDSCVKLTFQRNIGDPHGMSDFDLATLHGVLNMMLSHILKDPKGTGKSTMVQINEGYYLPKEAKEITGLQGLKYPYKLSNWPGYKPLLMQYDGGLMLNLDLSSKYVRTGTALNCIETIIRPGQTATDDLCRDATIAMKGLIVITTYNNVAYKIMEVTNKTSLTTLFSKTTRGAVSNKFTEQKMELTIASYLSKIYGNIEIKCKSQPMLLCVKADGEKHRAAPGKPPRDEYVPLVPELCLLSGLTDDLKTNMSNWNKILDSARKEPGPRAELVKKFAVNLNLDVAARTTLTNWALSLGVELEEVMAREIPLVDLAQNQRPLPYERKDADWTRNLRGNRLDDPKQAHSLIIVCPEQKMAQAKILFETLKEVGRPMGMVFDAPLVHSITGNSMKDYAAALRNDPNTPHADIVLCLLPDNTKDRYNEIKQITTSADSAVPSQCMLVKNVDSKSAKSIITKVALQMNAKMGGAVWHIRSPAVKEKGVMIIGTSIGKGINFRGQKAVAFVATVNGSYSAFASEVEIIPSGMVPEMVYKKMIFKIITAYKQANQFSLPKTILLYRTMDFEQDMFEVTDNNKGELKLCLAALREIAPRAKLLFCVALKKCSSRFFADGVSANPNPGTIVDNKVTIPGRDDFYLISHSGKKGTVMPTYYFKVYNDTDVSGGDFHTFTFQMCHMYYNWSGTIKIPAVCQYAVKLATMISEVTHTQPDAKLGSKLWFL